MERTKEALQELESKVTGQPAPKRQTKADYIEEIANNFNQGGGSAGQFAHILINDSYTGGYTLTLDDNTIATYDDLVNYLIGKGMFTDCNGTGNVPEVVNVRVYPVAATGVQFSVQFDSPCIGFTVFKNYQYENPETSTMKTGNVLAITDGNNIGALLKEDIETFEVTYLGQ